MSKASEKWEEVRTKEKAIETVELLDYSMDGYYESKDFRLRIENLKKFIEDNYV